MEPNRTIPNLIVAAWVGIILSPLLGLARHPCPGQIVPSETPPEEPVARIDAETISGQVFRADRDGLSGLGIIVQATGGPGKATWEMVLASKEGIPLHAGTFAPRMRWGMREIWFSLPPIPDSGGKEYRVWIRKIPGGGLRDLLVFGTSHDSDPTGNLASGWRDRNGDITLSRRYRTPSSALLPLPPPREAPWFASEPIRVLSLLLAGLGVVLILRHLARPIFVERIPIIAGSLPTAIVLVLAILGGDIPGRFPMSPGGTPVPPDDRQYSLLEEYHSPHTEHRPGGGIIGILGDEDPVIFMHPVMSPAQPPALRFRLALPPRPVLSFVPSLQEGAVEEGTDGAEFVVSVGDGEIWRRAFTPQELQARQRVEVDLSPWGGQTVDLILGTAPGGHHLADWVGWGEPRIASGHGP